MWIDISKLTKWKCVKELAVGGLEWVGFSKTYPNKLLCISSQKTTLIDCNNGIVNECDCEYDEESYIAICNLLPEELITISGEYGGKLLQITPRNEAIRIESLSNYITTVYFTDEFGVRV